MTEDGLERQLLPSLLEGIGQVPKEVAIKFIDVVASGIGTAYEPINRALMAASESYSQRKAAESLVDRNKILKGLSQDLSNSIATELLAGISDLSHEKKIEYLEILENNRSISQYINPEDRIIANKKKIIRKSIKYLPDSQSGGIISQDWIDSFFRYSEIVSDDELQEIWAQILAGKIENSSNISKKTLRIIQDLSQHQANIFVKLCSIVFSVDGTLLSIRLDNDTDRYLKFASIEFEDLLMLDDYGLVTLGVRTFRAEKGSEFRYFGKSFIATKEFQFKTNPLTAAGKDLFPLVHCEPNFPYFEEVKALFSDKIVPSREN